MRLDLVGSEQMDGKMGIGLDSVEHLAPVCPCGLAYRRTICMARHGRRNPVEIAACLAYHVIRQGELAAA